MFVTKKKKKKKKKNGLGRDDTTPRTSPTTCSYIALLVPEALKFTSGRNLIELTSHNVSRTLNSKVQSDNDSAFKAAVTQGVSKALGIEYHLHCS